MDEREKERPLAGTAKGDVWTAPDDDVDCIEELKHDE